MDYEAVIGLETHVQLNTLSKIFCSAGTTFGEDPNNLIDPLTFGLPGALPVVNKRVIDSAILLGLGLNCQIRKFNRFARKHYFYPDLPKGYQISQSDEPICEHGRVTIEDNGTSRTIGITRIHMEEDAGKSIHDARTNSSLVDLNRAGVPLLEIVSQPDIRNAVEAGLYLKVIRQIVRWLGISDGNMEEGSLRCDANISLRPVGQLKFGTRAEIKNINSFKYVEKAIEYEIARQLKILKEGGTVIQETRLFNSETETTHEMRGKEGAADYRYFADPDLPPVVIEESWIQKIRQTMPVLPSEKKLELINTHKLTEYDAEVLTTEREFSDYFDAVFKVCKDAKLSCNWITSELFGALKKLHIDFSNNPISSEVLGELIKLIKEEVISGKMAKTIFEILIENPSKKIQEIIKEKGLKLISDPEEIRVLVNEVFKNNADNLKKFLDGNNKLHGFFVGQVLKLSAGNAKPELVNQIITEELKKIK